MSVFSFFAASCPERTFLGFPSWYKYLPGDNTANGCSPRIDKLTDIWLIAAAVSDMLLRLAALISIAFIIYGGFQMITSQGEPQGMQKGRQTVINALIGLVISIAAATIISFVAGKFSES